MKIIRMNSLAKETGGKTAAFFDIQTDDGIIIKGFKLVNGINGLFISSPDAKGKDGKYYEKVILPVEIKKTVEKLAIEEYSSSEVSEVA